MKRFVGWMLIGCLAGLTAWAGEYSADSTTTIGEQTIKGKVYIKGEKIRQETEMMGAKSIIIIDRENQKLYIINTASKTYMEMDQSSPMFQMQAKKLEAESSANRTEAGEEKVSGYTCKKYVYKDPGGMGGETTTWVCDKLGWYPVKSSSGSGQTATTIQLTNIKEGNVPDSLFKPPAGYTKQEMPGMGGAWK